MNINAMTRPEYIEFLYEKGILTTKDIVGDTWGITSSKKELAFLESGYPFEPDTTFEMALSTRAKWMGFRKEFRAYDVQNMQIFQQVKDMADWKRHLSLSMIRYSIWERA